MRLIGAWLFVVGLPCGILAQDQERAREIEKLRELESREYRPESLEPTYLDYGGWARPQYFVVEDGSGQHRGKQEYEIRLWIDYGYLDIHRVYVRTQASYFAYNEGDAPEGDQQDLTWPRVDVAFYQIDLGRALGGPGRSWDASVRIGRQYYRLGSGLLLNGVLDGVSGRYRAGMFDLNLFALRTQPHDDDLDRSIPESDNSDRYFFGAAVELALDRDFVPYVLAVIERDQNDNEGVPGQDFDWDTEYWGLGFRGAPLIPNLAIQLEGIYQTGERFAAFMDTDPEQIQAWGVVSDISLYFHQPLSGRASIGFLFGSGDHNRFAVPNTALGNVPGSKDRTFIAFGYVPTGFVLNPMVANILIYKAGLSVRPIRPATAFDITELEIGVDGYWYEKHKKDGGISDPFMGNEEWIGWEVDGYANFILTSDLSFTVRAGFFEPGDAPLLDEERTFFLASMIYSF